MDKCLDDFEAFRKLLDLRFRTGCCQFLAQSLSLLFEIDTL